MAQLILFFRLASVAVAVYAFWRGGRDERWVAMICLVGLILTHLVISPLAARFSSVEIKVFLVDVAMLAAFALTALRSERRWPLWVAGLQLTTILGHFLKEIDNSLLPRAYGMALGFWAYPIVAILAIGIWRHDRRTRQSDTATP